MRLDSWGFALVVLLSGLPSFDAVEADEPSLRELLGDDGELQIAVRAWGDEPVLAALDADSRSERLAAIEAVRWIDAPEQALPRLAALAGGDDPDAAPAAARALAKIASKLAERDFAVGETDTVAIPEGLEELPGRAAARADVRLHAGVALAALRVVIHGVPDGADE